MRYATLGSERAASAVPGREENAMSTTVLGVRTPTPFVLDQEFIHGISAVPPAGAAGRVLR
ncbi:MAG: hypothetical protein ACRCYX_02510 [Dermatophilaceae bacterium]